MIKTEAYWIDGIQGPLGDPYDRGRPGITVNKYHNVNTDKPATTIAHLSESYLGVDIHNNVVAAICHLEAVAVAVGLKDVAWRAVLEYSWYIL